MVLRARRNLPDKLLERQKRECLLDFGAGAAYAKFIKRLRRKVFILSRVFLPLGRRQRLKLFCGHGAHVSRYLFTAILLVAVLELLLLSELGVVCARGVLI